VRSAPENIRELHSRVMTSNYVFGRYVHHDPRSRNFVAELESVVAPRTWPLNPGAQVLDQGQIGSCTANAVVDALNCTAGQPFRDETVAQRLYHVETVNEGQPWPPNDPGGSGLEVCKAAVQLGLIKSYGHVFSASQALQALMLRPLITGIPWFSSFDHPNATGVVKLTSTATIRGGHEIAVVGWDGKRVWFQNSWGPGWGASGRFAMSLSDWQHCLDQQGDVTVPVP